MTTRKVAYFGETQKINVSGGKAPAEKNNSPPQPNFDEYKELGYALYVT